MPPVLVWNIKPNTLEHVECVTDEVKALLPCGALKEMTLVIKTPKEWHSGTVGCGCHGDATM
jgi:hypothetical protein